MARSTGRIKAGEGTLIGNAGEFYVVAELLKRRVIAALAPRNSPGFDVLATKGEKTVKIRVKTKSESYDIWQWSVRKDGTIFRNLSEGDDFIVLVNLAFERSDLAFYVLPTILVNKWLVQDFKTWLATPGQHGKPRSPTNKKRHLAFSRYQGRLIKEYRDNWDVLWS